MRNAVNAAYFIGTTAPMYKINHSLSVFHTIPEFVSTNSLFLKNVTTPSVSTVLDHQAQLAQITKGMQRNTPLLLSVWFFVLFSLCSSSLFFLLWLLAPVKQFKNINNCDP